MEPQDRLQSVAHLHAVRGWQPKWAVNLYICLYVCLFVFNNWTDRAKILCGTLHDPREGLRMLRITKNCLRTILILENFLKSTKNIIKFYFFVCYCFILYKEKMCTDEPQFKVEIVGGREKYLPWENLCDGFLGFKLHNQMVQPILELGFFMIIMRVQYTGHVIQTETRDYYTALPLVGVLVT